MKKYKELGPTQKKILIILGGGLSLGLTHSFRLQQKIFQEMKKDWAEANKQSTERALLLLKEGKFIGVRSDSEGGWIAKLTKKGQQSMREISLYKLEIKKPAIWDKRWRIIIFDIPESRRNIRNELRRHLRRLGFYKLQQSVFILPFNCREEIERIAKFYKIYDNLEFIEAVKVTTEKELKKHFKLDQMPKLH